MHAVRREKTKIWYNLYHRQLALKTKTYYYHFDHLGSASFADILIDKFYLLKKLIGYHSTLGVGVSHADEVFYLFKYVIQIWKLFAFFY